MACGFHPACVVPDHRVENCQQLSGTSDECHLLRLPRGDQPLVENLEDRIPAPAAQHRHEERGANTGATTPHHAFPAQRPAISSQRGNTSERGRLLVAERPEFRQFPEQGRTHDRAHPGYTLQQIVLRPPDGARFNEPGQLLRHVIQLPLQPADVRLDPAMQWLRGEAQPILLRREHLQQLAAAREHGVEQLCRPIGQGARCRTYPLGEEGQNPGVEAIRLGELACGSGRVPNLPGIRDYDREARGGERGDRRPLEPAGGFTDDQGGSQQPQAGDELRRSGVGVGHAPALAARPQGHIDERR